MVTLIEEKSGTFPSSYGEVVYTVYYNRWVWDLGNGTFLTKYGSAHFGQCINTYWMTQWRPAPTFWRPKKRQIIKEWEIKE